MILMIGSKTCATINVQTGLPVRLKPRNALEPHWVLGLVRNI